MFTLDATDSGARAGTLTTKSGSVQTPFFMPVATKGTVKFLDSRMLPEMGTQAIIANTFILSLKPGIEVIDSFGGFHDFMQYKGTIFTDSGGFQMYSENLFIKATDDVLIFRNPFTGKKVEMTPELNMELHIGINSDVAMCLDDMPLLGADRQRIAESAKRTFAWAQRCKKHHASINEKGQLLFGIAQGGIFPDLREECAKQIASLDFDGVAFGGLALGEEPEKMYETIRAGIDHLPHDKPRYLMGVGEPVQLLEAIALGVDCFDSRFPTKNARHDTLFSADGLIKILHTKHAQDKRPIDPSCRCPTCRTYSRAFIHHLARLKDPSCHIHKTIHNLSFLHQLMEDCRTAIVEGKFKEFKNEFIRRYTTS